MTWQGFLGDVTRVVANALLTPNRNLVDGVEQRNANALVLELNGSRSKDQVHNYPIYTRRECLVLHGPMEPAMFPLRFNIILHEPAPSDRMFSLFRTNDQEEAEQIFIYFQECISPLVKIDSRAICNITLLERMSVAIRGHPGWSAVHLLAHLDLHNYFKHETLVTQLNKQEEAQNKTPLHVAVERNNLSSVNALLGHGAQLDITDLHNNNVIHIAVSSPAGSVAILRRLLEEAEQKSPMLKDLVNNEGYTPLLMACKQDSAEQVQTLLEFGANVNIANKGTYPIHLAIKAKSECSVKEIVTRNKEQLQLKDLKEGGTPLHWAQTSEIIKLLLDLGCDPNIVDSRGGSALHRAVKRGDLKAVLLLLSHEAHPDLRDDDGETPLHVAARLCSRHILQALIVFRADIDSQNNRGFTARHLLCTSGRSDSDQVLFFLDRVGAQRCPPSSNECPPGCRATGDVRGTSPVNCVLSNEINLMEEALSAFCIGAGIRANDISASASSSNSYQRRDSLDKTVGGRLLTLDGGGIRGLCLIQMLLVIEELVGWPVTSLFDWVSGTSTGGILGLGLAVGKTVLEMQALYIRLKDSVFGGDRPYCSEKMDTFLKKEFGQELKMSDIRRPRVLITTTIINTRPAEFHLFRNYLSPSTILNQTSEGDPHLEEYVWKVAKWTGAAPSYFKLDGSNYIDGGMVSNNPTLDALTELTQFAIAMKSVGEFQSQKVEIPNVVVSLGCGVQPKQPVNPAHLDISWPRGVMDTVSALPKLPVMFNLLVDQATQSEGQVVERSRAWCSSIGVPFFRFSPPCPCFVDLDETSDEILVDLMWYTRAYMLQKKDKIRELKEVLVSRAPSSQEYGEQMEQ